MNPLWNLIINGRKAILIPRNVRCYDNGGETIDRYTIVFTRLGKKLGYPAIFTSDSPTHPMGVFSMDDCDYYLDKPKRNPDLGKKIKFTDLPNEVQSIVSKKYHEAYSTPN